jgi:putative ABC transport system substrate-binding protein
MRRRELITLLGGGAVAWPLAVRAQPADRVRLLGVLTGFAENDPEGQRRMAAFRDALATLGWVEGRNVRIAVRYAANAADEMQTQAAELVGLMPSVIYAATGPATRAVQRHTKTIPIVFEGAGGLTSNPPVTNIARPEGNTTGFANSVDSIGGKWLELLKEVAPGAAKVGFIVDPESVRRGRTSGYVPSIEDAAHALSVKLISLPFRDAGEVERGIDAFASEPNGGLIVHPLANDRELIFRLAIQHRLPVVAQSKIDAAAGSLISYASDPSERAPGVAYYVDRILRGAKPGDLPVQFPKRFVLYVNLKTARALGLTIPLGLQATAEELIE